MTSWQPTELQTPSCEHQRRQRCHRRGIMLFDLAFGSAAIAVIMVGTMVVATGFKKQQQQSTEYFLAHQYLANAAEAIDAAEPGDEATITLPDSAKQALANAELRIEVQPAVPPQGTDSNHTAHEIFADEIFGDEVFADLNQITCTIRWRPHSSPNERSTSLTLWKPASPPNNIESESKE